MVALSDTEGCFLLPAQLPHTLANPIRSLFYFH